MKKLFFISFLSLLFVSFRSDTTIEDDLNTALINAKKGMYWGLSNLKLKKAKLDGKLIDNNQLLSEIKIAKEINGIKLESTGYNNSTEVTVKIFRSYNNLIKDGYIDRPLDE